MSRSLATLFNLPRPFAKSLTAIAFLSKIEVSNEPRESINLITVPPPNATAIARAPIPEASPQNANPIAPSAIAFSMVTTSNILVNPPNTLATALPNAPIIFAIPPNTEPITLPTASIAGAISLIANPIPTIANVNTSITGIAGVNAINPAANDASPVPNDAKNVVTPVPTLTKTPPTDAPKLVTPPAILVIALPTAIPAPPARDLKRNKPPTVVAIPAPYS